MNQEKVNQTVELINSLSRPELKEVVRQLKFNKLMKLRDLTSNFTHCIMIFSSKKTRREEMEKHGF